MELTGVVSGALSLRPSSNRTDGFYIFGSPNSFSGRLSIWPWSAVPRVHNVWAARPWGNLATDFSDQRACASASDESSSG